MAGEFGAFIAQKRLEKDVKLKPIADKLGVSVTYLSDIIKGRRNPPDSADCRESRFDRKTGGF